jgi:tRNA(Ile)-lysidine synthase
MIQRFLNYINQNNLFNSSERVLLAISGGLDSVVMCHLFYTAKIPFAIAHCNFQLRGIIRSTTWRQLQHHSAFY